MLKSISFLQIHLQNSEQYKYLWLTCAYNYVDEFRLTIKICTGDLPHLPSIYKYTHNNKTDAFKLEGYLKVSLIFIRFLNSDGVIVMISLHCLFENLMKNIDALRWKLHYLQTLFVNFNPE